jgi:hypothetical protein
MRRFDSEDNTRVDVLESGLIDFWSRREPVRTSSYPREDIHFYVNWLLGDYLSVIDLIDKVRSLADVPDWEFAIEFALDINGVTPPNVIKIVRQRIHTSSIQLPVIFPRIPYRNRSERDEILNLFADDLGDAAGDRRNPHHFAPPLKILD